MKTYPISEIFVSVQGEGYFQGTPHVFVRFAGCSVGKPIPAAIKGDRPAYVEQCRIWSGAVFDCDTDFRVKERLTSQEILERIPNNGIRVCFTGGEPLIHDLTELAQRILGRAHPISIETSGTIELPAWAEGVAWVTVAPKWEVLPRMLASADEIKLLVGPDFDEVKAMEFLAGAPRQSLIWIQPVNREHEVDRVNLDRCLALLLSHPQWRLSVQLHKLLHVR